MKLVDRSATQIVNGFQLSRVARDSRISRQGIDEVLAVVVCWVSFDNQDSIYRRDFDRNKSRIVSHQRIRSESQVNSVPTWQIECQIEFLVDGNARFHSIKIDSQWQLLSVLKNVDRNLRGDLVAEVLNRQSEPHGHTD